MPQRHVWGWCSPQTTSYIHIRYIQSVWDIGMLSQGHMVAPLYHYTGQVGPRFGKSGSLEEWKRCHNVMFEADIHLRPLHTSILDIYKVFELLVCCLKGIWLHPYRYTGQVGPRFGKSGSPEEWKWCHKVMFEADIHLRLIHASIVDIYKVLSHWYAVSRAYGCTLIPLHRPSWPQIWEVNSITPCLRLISTSDCFIHPY